MVTIPPNTQTRPNNEVQPTRAMIGAGVLKIPDPMILLITMEIASMSPRSRLYSVESPKSLICEVISVVEIVTSWCFKFLVRAAYEKFIAKCSIYGSRAINMDILKMGVVLHSVDSAYQRYLTAKFSRSKWVIIIISGSVLRISLKSTIFCCKTLECINACFSIKLLNG